MKTGKEFLKEIYGLMAPKEVRSFYDDTARDYDRILLDEVGYVSPRICAAKFASFFDAKDARIVDLGCGTGLMGEELNRLGFAHVDGADFSRKMLAVAEAKGCYAALIEADLNRPLDFPTGGYSAAVSAGSFGQHIGPRVLDEVVRIVEPGGVICFSVNELGFDEYGFREKVDLLLARDAVESLSLTKEDYHVKAGIDGWVCVLRTQLNSP